MTHLENSGSEKCTFKRIDTPPTRPEATERRQNRARKISKVRALRDYLPAPTEDYVLDCEAGHLCARELLAEMATGKCADCESTIGAMIFVMVEHQYHKNATGVIVGFMAEISRHLQLRPSHPIVKD